MRPCVESNCKGGYPCGVTWVTCKWKEEVGEGHREARRKEGGARVYNGQGALEEQRLTGESGKVGPWRGTATEY